MQHIHLTGQIPEHAAGSRIDQALAQLFPSYSRARLTQWLKAKQITLNGQYVLPKNKVQGGECVEIKAELIEEAWHTAENLPVDIIFEDDYLLIVNKPANLVVHPAHGNFQHTLVNALLHHCPALQYLPRAGLIHRLDKDTTGLLIIAKTLEAHHALVKAMQERRIHRTYQAIAFGEAPPQGTIRTYIHRHPTQRTKMAVCAIRNERSEDGITKVRATEGKPAVTHFTTLAQYHKFSHLEVKLETGRTHQIRVHLAHIRLPIIGDPLYGIPNPPFIPAELMFKRQALHAYQLALIHPILETELSFQAPLPSDFSQLLTYLIENL